VIHITIFSHLPMTCSAASSQAAIAEPTDSRELAKLTEKGFLEPGQPPFLNWAWLLWYGVFPLASLG